MNKFNLTEEPWIPCRMPNGTLQELSLTKTLVNAHEISEVVDDSPLVVISLYRFLLAILHRNFGPKNFEEWKTLWSNGCWDAATISNYFAEWHHRFNLFDETRPFYQYNSVLKAKGLEADVVPIEILMQEKAGGNNATLFDHSFETKVTSYPTSVVTRYLIARQGFSIGFGKSHPFYFSDSTTIRGLTLLNVGNSLFETLALNLVPYSGDKPIPVQEEGGRSLDMPFWERSSLDEAGEEDHAGTLPLGYLDYLTWQSRRIRLFPERDGTAVSKCQIQQNFKLIGDNLFDPFKVYTSDEKTGWRAQGISPERAVWRDSHTLLRKSDSSTKQAAVLSIPSKLMLARDEGQIEAQRRYSLAVFGIATEVGKAANIVLWTHERLPLPLVYLSEDDLLASLQKCLEFTEEIGKALRAGVRVLIHTLAERADDKRKNKTEAFPAQESYWSQMELRFHMLLERLPSETEAEMRAWFADTLQTATKAFRDTLKGLSGTAAETKAVVNAENEFWRSIYGSIKRNPNSWQAYLPKQFAAKGDGMMN
ncbi:MAG TPA: type I-E CRISPR-associated protein Cse1/CasA [Pyrinomonadaceae bacterium]|nr:type I-E CRISPR-associated protein Cse1/CasA [Pyrinomonadaceae bacterium]HMP66996.1 type I-E CRISPR-associated protein Cse1/CasA [Pyrinomonadaceae bacterium]